MTVLQHASCCLVLLASTVSATGLTQFECQAQIGGKPVAFHLALDDATTLVKVDAVIAPATYTASHVKFRPAVHGPVFLMGRRTGRLLVMNDKGISLGAGRCTAVTLA